MPLLQDLRCAGSPPSHALVSFPPVAGPPRGEPRCPLPHVRPEADPPCEPTTGRPRRPDRSGPGLLPGRGDSWLPHGRRPRQGRVRRGGIGREPPPPSLALQPSPADALPARHVDRPISRPSPPLRGDRCDVSRSPRRVTSPRPAHTSTRPPARMRLQCGLPVHGDVSASRPGRSSSRSVSSHNLT